MAPQMVSSPDEISVHRDSLPSLTVALRSQLDAEAEQEAAVEVTWGTSTATTHLINLFLVVLTSARYV